MDSNNPNINNPVGDGFQAGPFFQEGDQLPGGPGKQDPPRIIPGPRENWSDLTDAENAEAAASHQPNQVRPQKPSVQFQGPNEGKKGNSVGFAFPSPPGPLPPSQLLEEDNSDGLTKIRTAYVGQSQVWQSGSSQVSPCEKKNQIHEVSTTSDNDGHDTEGDQTVIVNEGYSFNFGTAMTFRQVSKQEKQEWLSRRHSTPAKPVPSRGVSSGSSGYGESLNQADSSESSCKNLFPNPPKSTKGQITNSDGPISPPRKWSSFPASPKSGDSKTEKTKTTYLNRKSGSGKAKKHHLKREGRSNQKQF